MYLTGITVNIVADKVTIGTNEIQYEEQVGNSEDGNGSEDVSCDNNGNESILCKMMI